MEKEELDYEPEEEELGPVKEQRIKGSSYNRKRSIPCCLCTGRFVDIMKHVLRIQVPWYTTPPLACWTGQLKFGQQGALTIHCNDYHDYEQTHGTKDELLIGWLEILLIELCRQLNVSTLDKLVIFASEMSNYKTV